MVGDVIATEGDVESAAPIPLPVTIGEIVPPPVAKFRLALTLAQYGYVLQTGQLVMQGKAQDLLRDEGVKKAYLGL